MERLIIKESVHADRQVPLDISSIAGGTMSGHFQGEVTSTGQTSLDMTLVSVDVNFSLTLTPPTKELGREQRFRRLADQWRRETRHQSSASKMAMHPAYQQIIGMGRDAIPFILRELRRTRGHWLWALFAITGEDPAPEGSTFAEAVDAWLSWGTQHGYAPPD